MNIGIDFNTKTIKGTFWKSGQNIADSKVFEVKNVLVFTNGDIFAGDDGFNKFLTEKDGTIYDLEQIIEWNGLIVNKKQISAEKCLSVIFANLLNKIKNHASYSEVNFVCVSIPFDKYYYWHGLVKKAFSLVGIEKVRVVSQPAAFFGQPDINYFHGNLNRENIQREQQQKYLHNQEVKKYEELPWYKKFVNKKPRYKGEHENSGYIFASISQDNVNVSLVNYGEDVLEVVSTQYTNSTTRSKIENAILDYFISEISKDPKKFAVKDKKTLLRILETVNEFLKSPQISNTFEIRIPFVLCENGKYETLEVKIDVDSLANFLSPILNDLTRAIKTLAEKTQEAQKDYKYKTKISNLIVVGDSFIQQNIKENLSKAFSDSKIAFGNEKSLTIGALNFSRIMTGENRDFLALEVIPFSVLIRLRGGEFVEMIRKDTTTPTISKEHNFEIKGESKSKFVEVHLTTKEGDIFQSLNVWRIEAPNTRIFKITVDIDANMKIMLNAYSESGKKLSVQMGNTFSFSGAGFDVGIKGKDIRQYILNQFNYLNAVLESKETTIFEPDETFYTMLKDGDPFKALRYLGHFLKLKSLPDVEMADSKFFEEQGIGGFISGSKISIPKYFTKDPYGFGYVLAHELAHYILIHEQQIILDDEQENEILTEIFVIYSGMGKLFLNGFKSKDVEGSSLHARGYLDEKILQYIHQIYLARFNVDVIAYKKSLTSEAVRMLNELVSEKR